MTSHESDDSGGSASVIQRVERYPDGRIPASRRYIDYDGQVIIRTRCATVQRWKKAGWDGGRKGRAPYVLESHYCTGEDEVLEVRNEELDERQFSIYYCDDGETVVYEVDDDGE